MGEGEFTTIDLQVDADGIALLTLDRPDRLNAFTAVMQNELIAAFDRTDTDDAVRAVVVTGRGRAFCAGADPAKLNARGGAIALGHPLGGSGTRLLATLVNHLEATGGRYGLQTMCVGGGMANATIIERL